MRFRSSRGRLPYLNSRDQRRMLRLVALLILVLIAMRIAAREQTWSWLFPKEAAQQSEAGESHQGPAGPRSPDEIDFRVRLEEDAALPAADGATKDSPPVRSVEIDPALLRAVRDNTLGIRADEREAYYAVLARAAALPQQALEQPAQEGIAYTTLMINPDEFRGKLLTIEGQARRVWKLTDLDDETGLPGAELYEAWILTSDSGDRPYRVVFSDLPSGLPTVEKTTAPVRVRVTGYFFKKEGYQSEGGLTVAPLILAGSIQYFPPPQRGRADQNWGPYLITGVACLGLIIAVAAWRISTRDRQFQRHVDRIMKASPESIAALEGVPTVEPDEKFREIAEQVEQAEANSSEGDEKSAN